MGENVKDTRIVDAKDVTAEQWAAFKPMGAERAFTLTAEQEAKLDEWISTHQKKDCGAVGGRYSFTFTPTTIGTCVSVTDEMTGHKIDLSDYEKW